MTNGRVDPTADPRATHPGVPASDGRGDWRRLLTGGSPREVLARIVTGDPLEVRPIVARRLRERSLLMDGDRAHLRALARCARYGVRYTGRPKLAAWLARQVDAALDDLMRETAAEARAADPVALEPGSAYADLARPLGLDPEAMRRACVAFNARPEPERQALFALVVEVRTLDEAARAAEVSASEFARRARRALDVVLGSMDGGAS